MLVAQAPQSGISKSARAFEAFRSLLPEPPQTGKSGSSQTSGHVVPVVDSAVQFSGMTQLFQRSGFGRSDGRGNPQTRTAGT